MTAWVTVGDDTADKNRAQCKSKKAMTKKTRLKQKKWNHERSQR